MLSQAMMASTDMYKENGRILALLEDKAQKTATLAGGFLAAAFAFLRRDTLRDLANSEGYFGLVLLAIATGLLLLCVFMAGAVLWARTLRLPPDARKVAQYCNTLLGQSATSPTDEQRENHLRDQIDGWNKTIRFQNVVIMNKSKRLKTTQKLLAGGMSAVTLLLILLIFSRSSTEKSTPSDRLYQLTPIVGRNNGTVY
jgi:hypothetical protein